MVGSPWVEVVLRLFNQIPMYQSYTLRQANLAPEKLWLKEKDRQGTNYILSGTQNCDGQFPISRWFSYIAHCKTSMYRAFPIATFDLLDGNEMTHSLISWIWGRTSMASIASVMVYAMPWLQCTTGGWLTWRNLISPNYTELYNHPNKTDCPPTSSASLGLPTYPYLPDIHVYIYMVIVIVVADSTPMPHACPNRKTSERPRLALRFALGLGFGHGLLRHLGLCAAERWVYLGEPQILWPNQCWVSGKMDKDDETSWNQGFVTTPIFNRSTKPDRHHLQQPPQPPLSPRVSASPPPGGRYAQPHMEDMCMHTS